MFQFWSFSLTVPLSFSCCREMWAEKVCTLDMFMTFYEMYHRPCGSYRDFLRDVLTVYESVIKWVFLLIYLYSYFSFLFVFLFSPFTSLSLSLSLLQKQDKRERTVNTTGSRQRARRYARIEGRTGGKKTLVSKQPNILSNYRMFSWFWQSKLKLM